VSIKAGLIRTTSVLSPPKPVSAIRSVVSSTGTQKAPRCVVAVHPGHADIQEDQRRPECGGDFERRWSIVHHPDVVAPDAQQRGETFRRVLHLESRIGLLFDLDRLMLVRTMA
jgi:hypothetical protein